MAAKQEADRVKSFRATEEEETALTQAAEAEDRPIAYIMRRAVAEWLRAHGWLKQGAAE
jgi:predicted transcriptional regulator